MNMHDWVFLGLSFVWTDGSCSLEFKDNSSNVRTILVNDIRKLTIPRFAEWGESVNVNKVYGPFDENGYKTLEIQMQSGDQILIVAAHIEVPL
jgi:hypothetical protein